MFSIRHPLAPLIAAVLLLFIAFLFCLNTQPLIDAHPEWQSVWNPLHIQAAAARWTAWFINTAIALSVLSWVWVIRMCFKKNNSISILWALFLGNLVFHLGCMWIPYAGNGLFHAHHAIGSGFYDPKTLPPSLDLLRNIWLLLLTAHFFASIGCLLYIGYLAFRRQFSLRFLFFCQLFVSDFILSTLIPDFWVWFMD